MVSFALFRDVAFVIISRLFNVKINIHFHFGRIPTIFKNKSWEYYILKWITNKANRVVVMDDLSYKTLLSHGISNVDNIPNPISPIIVNEVRKLSENCLREDKRILFVGHLIKTKGVFELINAMSRIKDYNLYLVGSTKDSTKARILQNLTDNNIDNVYLLDELSQEDVIKEMLKATIFILPSYSEGFPNVILESMICSCQIIATNVGAIPQMLNVNSDKIAGICIKPRSESEIINAIIHLGKNNNEANKIAKNAYERICDYYTVDKVWSKLEELWIS